MTCRPNRASGSRTGLWLQEETCWGTLAEESSPPVEMEAIGLEFRSETLQDEFSNIESELLSGNRMRRAPQRGNRTPGGRVQGELQPHGPWPLIMKHFLGGDGTPGSEVSTSGSGPYQHVMQGNIFLPEGLTLEKRFTFRDLSNIYLRYLGGLVNNFEIVQPLSGITTIAADFVFREERQVDDPMDASPTYPTDNEPFNSFSATIYMDTDGDGDREAIATVRTITLRGANNIDTEGFAQDGTGLRADATEGNRVINGDIDIFFTKETYELYTASKENTTLSMEIIFTRGDYSWHFTIPAMKLRIPTPQTPGPQALNLAGTFEAFESQDDGTDIMLTIVNTDPAISTAA